MAGQLRLVGLSDEEFLILPKLIQSCLMETTLSPQRSVCTFHKVRVVSFLISIRKKFSFSAGPWRFDDSIGRPVPVSGNDCAFPVRYGTNAASADPDDAECLVVLADHPPKRQGDSDCVL